MTGNIELANPKQTLRTLIRKINENHALGFMENKASYTHDAYCDHIILNIILLNSLKQYNLMFRSYQPNIQVKLQ